MSPLDLASALAIGAGPEKAQSPLALQAEVSRPLSVGLRPTLSIDLRPGVGTTVTHQLVGSNNAPSNMISRAKSTPSVVMVSRVVMKIISTRPRPSMNATCE
jgi:hypothetical protein